MSINEICNNGCRVTFSATDATVYSSTNDVLFSSPKRISDVLWPFHITYTPQSSLTNVPVNVAINNVHNHYDADFVAYTCRSLGNPVLSTLLHALRKGFLATIDPRFTSKLVLQHIPYQAAVAMGHLDLIRQHTNSTRPTEESNSVDIAEPIAPNLATHPTLFEYQSDTLYTDATGTMPWPSEGGDIYCLVGVCNNFIHAVPMKRRLAESVLEAHTEMFNFFKSLAIIPTKLRTDNELSSHLEAHSKLHGFTHYSTVPPSNHRANKAERAIRSFKNHFLASMATCSAQFPWAQWKKCLPQILLTLNLLRPSLTDPSTSAYEVMYGEPYDFMAHPLHPLGMLTMVHDRPAVRGSWDTHGSLGYYVGPALNSYS